MPLRWEDLPADVRRKAASSGHELGATHDGIRTPPARARKLDPPKDGAWICATCSFKPRSWAAAERHADTTGHHRIECRLEGAP